MFGVIERLGAGGVTRAGLAAAVMSAVPLATVMPAHAQDVTTIKVLNWQPGGAEYWDALVPAFEKANPDVKVELETVPFDRYAEVQGPYITTRSGPDVMENNAGLELFFNRNGARRQLV